MSQVRVAVREALARRLFLSSFFPCLAELPGLLRIPSISYLCGRAAAV